VRRRTVSLVAAAASVMAAWMMSASSVLAAGGVSIREADVTEFPTVRLVVSTRESIALDTSDVSVVENGVAVEVVDVYPLGVDSGAVDAILAIDGSNSMRGEPLRTALAAARTFLDGVPASMPLGVLTFSDEPVVLSPVSDDRPSVESAVASLTATTSQGTALFNTVVRASAMFTSSGQHNLVLLTDGRCKADPTEFGPCTLDGSLEDAVDAANEAGVTVFTIGLSRSGTAVPTLERIADMTGGDHTIISLSELEGVYAGLAKEFSAQYVVEYRSKAPFGGAVRVDARLPSGKATFGFLAPAHRTPTSVTGEAEALISFWTRPIGMGVVAGLTFLAVLGIGLAVANTDARRRRERQLRSSLVRDVDPTSDRTADGARGHAIAVIPRPFVDAAERVAAGTEMGRRLALRLPHAGWAIRSGEFLWMVVAAALVLGVVGLLVANVVGALAGVTVGTLVPFALLSRAASSRRAAIQAQLADTLMVIASSMRAGHSFLQSLDSAAKEVDEPAAGEFGRVLREIRLGRDTDSALDVLVERVGSQDLEWAVTAIKIQRKIGGNLAEVLETVAKTIRERETLRRQVKVLSAEGRISIVVLTVLPILLAGYIMLVNPEYLRTLTTTTPGVAISISGGVLMAIGYVWMRKIVKLDV
jgi:tight adherence protein B